MNTLHSRLALSLGAFLLLSAGRLHAAPSAAFTLIGAHAETLTPAALASAGKPPTAGLLSVSKKSIILSSSTIPLLAVTGPDTDMLSYRMAGLRNPTLVVPHGAAFTVLFANTDDDMFHNIRFGKAQAHYPNVMDIVLKSSIGTPPLAHRTEKAIHAEQLTLRAPTVPGTYAYFCTVRGHAQSGMTGEVIVR